MVIFNTYIRTYCRKNHSSSTVDGEKSIVNAKKFNSIRDLGEGGDEKLNKIIVEFTVISNI